MAKTNSNSTVKPVSSTAQSAPKTENRGFGGWFVRNLLLFVIGYLVFSNVCSFNPGYNWLKEAYLKNNLQIVKENPNLTYDEKLQAKLGADYNYLLYLRDNTPEDAVIYYPSMGDFKATSPYVQQNPFNGKLNDKLTAVRVLYPRKVVTEDEYGKTSWTKKITHVGIMNGKNREKLTYAVPESFAIGVLPVKQPVQK